MDPVEAAAQQQRQPIVDGQENNNNNNNNNDRIVMTKIPWFKVLTILLLLFLTAVLQVTVWSLEVYLEQEQKSIVQQSSNANKKKYHNHYNQKGVVVQKQTTAEIDDDDNNNNNNEDQKQLLEESPPAPPLTVGSRTNKNNDEENKDEDFIVSTEDNTDSNNNNNNNNEDEDDNLSSNEKKNINNEKNKKSTVQNMEPVDMDQIYFIQQQKQQQNQQQKYYSGRSASTIAIAYWNIVLQSGIFDWEIQDSIPSIGATGLIRGRKQQQQRQPHPTVNHNKQQDSITTTRTRRYYNSNNNNNDESNQNTRIDGSSSSNPETLSMKSTNDDSNNNNNDNNNHDSGGILSSVVRSVTSFFFFGRQIRKSGGNEQNTEYKYYDHQDIIFDNIPFLGNDNTNNNSAGAVDIMLQKQRYDEHYNKTIRAIYALHKAAEYGHPEAQLRLANALAAGYYPYIIGDGTTATTASNSNDNIYLYHPSVVHYGKNNQIVPVSDEWLMDSENPVHAHAMLLWHMAAQHGNIDAAIILANRLMVEHTTRPVNSNSNKQQTSKKKNNAVSIQQEQCLLRLPYYAAAAHGIMDQLQTSDQSRGHVLPARDKHVLYQIHLHTRDTPDNRPDERLDALEYYQVKANELIVQLAHQQQQTESSTSQTDHMLPGDAAIAAYTLGRYYHTGVRGALQNLTLALQYYEAAGYNGHWEAAGQAGLLYLWGIGTKQNVVRAYKLFRLGMPSGYDGCFHNYQVKLRQEQLKQQIARNKHNKPHSNPLEDLGDTSILQEHVDLCDDASMNGMGLLLLFGIPMIVPVDKAVAVQFFQLARDQGSADAAYNLAMIRLGWKTHYRSIHDDLTKHTMDDDEDVDTKVKETSNTGDDSTRNNAQTLVDDDLYPLVQKPPGGIEESPEASLITSSGTTFDKKSRHFPTLQEYQQIMTDLTTAAGKNHIQANHRLAMMYEHGVQIPVTNTKQHQQEKKVGGSTPPMHQVIVPKDCAKATKHYKWIIETASPDLNARMRLAYKLYMAGNTADSLRHYLAVAEMGIDLAQVNAAFLLDQNECFQGLLSPAQCASAAVRLWKAASAKGNGEASLRVGDYYYYGKFRTNEESEIKSTAMNQEGSYNRRQLNRWSPTSRPFGWVQCVLFPEEFVFPYLIEITKDFIRNSYLAIYNYCFGMKQSSSGDQRKTSHGTELQASCADPQEDGSNTCKLTNEAGKVGMLDHDDSEDEIATTLESDMAAAARYYRLAAERNGIPRANYNLGFMYEWGLGLKQDFPLAKRHYDLAVATHHGESEVPVSLALLSLKVHEYIVKLKLSWENWLISSTQRSDSSTSSDADDSKRSSHSQKLSLTSGNEAIPVPSESKEAGRPVPGKTNKIPRQHFYDDMLIKTGNQVVDIILYHMLTWESLLIVALTIVATILMQRRFARTRRR